MTYFSNPPISNDDRKRLRREATIPERFLWSKLKGKKMLGYKFRRQFGVGNFIVDFYCPTLKLAIEVDGNTHEEIYDKWREKLLSQFGVKFLRFNDDDVLKDLDGVVQTIWNYIEKMQDPSQPPLCEGRG